MDVLINPMVRILLQCIRISNHFKHLEIVFVNNTSVELKQQPEQQPQTTHTCVLLNWVLCSSLLSPLVLFMMHPNPVLSRRPHCPTVPGLPPRCLCGSAGGEPGGLRFSRSL